MLGGAVPSSALSLLQNKQYMFHVTLFWSQTHIEEAKKTLEKYKLVLLAEIRYWNGQGVFHEHGFIIWLLLHVHSNIKCFKAL